MADEITVRANWFTRILRGVGLLPTGETAHVAGADYSASISASPQYDPVSAMSSYAAFPWVQASVNAISSDLAGLELKAVRGKGTDAELLDDHPMLKLMDQPSTRVNGLVFRRQMLLDLVLTGGAFAVIVGEREPLGLIRLHPQRTKVRPLADGQPECLEYEGVGSTLKYQWDEVMYVRTSSWSDDPSSLYGSGAIEALHNDLSTDYAASKTAAETAKIGRPTGVFSPASEGDYWTQDQITILREAFDKSMTAKSGALFLGGSAKYEALSWSPRDMEFQELRKNVRDSVLATFDVPPSRIGLPTANYATSLNQSRRYWEGLRGKAALIDSELTRIARLFGDDDIRIYHDFSNVEALQESRTDRLNRVQSWVFMGVPLSQAAELEGFDLPEFDNPTPKMDEEEEEERGGTAGVVQLFINADAKYIHPVTEEARGEIWRSFRDRLHTPNERRMAIEMRRYLTAWANRLSENVDRVLGKQAGLVGDVPGIKRALSDTEFNKIMDEAEEAVRLGKISERRLRLSMLSAFNEAQKLLPTEKMEFNPIRLDREVENQLARMVKQIQGNAHTGTNAEIRKLLTNALDEGASISTMQERLMSSHQFSAMRALRISRTETTKAVNSGALQAYASAADLGIDVKVEWLSARDDAVRDSHILPDKSGGVDGQVIEVGADFTLPDGTTGPGPGQMGVASEDINCRCTVIPVIGG